MVHHAGENVEVRSAGSQPGAEVHPLVVAALQKRGIDLSEPYSKPLTDDVVRAADHVITMGCGDAYPVYPGKRYLDWEIADPEAESAEGVRAIVAEIDTREL